MNERLLFNRDARISLEALHEKQYSTPVGYVLIFLRLMPVQA